MRCAAVGAVMHHRIAFGDQPNRECGRKRGDGNEWADSDSMNNMHCVNCVCVVHRPSGWFVFFFSFASLHFILIDMPFNKLCYKYFLRTRESVAYYWSYQLHGQRPHEPCQMIDRPGKQANSDLTACPTSNLHYHY